MLAPDSYKGSLSAAEAAEALAAGARRALAGLREVPELVPHPVADGGEGTLDVLARALPGARLRAVTVADPLGRPRPARWLQADGSLAVVEVAEACGLTLLAPHERDPLRAGTHGVGQLVRAALDAGCRRIHLALGGSATVDGGAGMAQALGFRLLDANGRPLPPGGGALARLARIDATGADPRLREAVFTALADVDNPLCGPEGAARVFAPQKGADPAAVERLDAGLGRLAAVLARDLGRSVAALPGAGAAGGLGAAVAGFLGGRILPGAEAVLDLTGLDRVLAGATLLITGEGRLDGTSRRGKAPVAAARRAARAGVPALALPGTLGPGWEALVPEPFAAVLPVWPEPPPALAGDPAVLLAATAERALRLLRLGARLKYGAGGA